MNASIEIIAEAEYYAHSKYLKVMLAVRTSLASVAFILLTALHWNRNKFVAHSSLKILLNFHFLWTYLTCIFVVTDHCYTAYLLVTMSSPSDLLQTETRCLLRKGAPCIVLYGAILSMFMMSFERQTASACFRTYERTSRLYGFKLAVAHIVMVGVFSVAFFVTYGYREPVVVLCTITSPRGEINHQIVASILVVMEMWTIFSFVRLLYINRKKQRQGGCLTLTERFQIAENVRMLRIMLPIVWSHVSITCVTIVIYLFVVAKGLTSRNFPLFEDTISLTFLQGFFMPLFFFKQFREEARHNREVIATNRVKGEALNTVHCAVIQAGWNGRLEKP